MIVSLPTDIGPFAITAASALAVLWWVLAPLFSHTVDSAQTTGVSPDVVKEHEGDAVDAAIAHAHSRLRSCVDCGPQPAPDAVYCWQCGRDLSGSQHPPQHGERRGCR